MQNEECRMMTFFGCLVKNGDAIFRREAPGPDEPEQFTIPIDSIKDAKLVLTDELISEALRRDKALRLANGIEDEPGNNQDQ